METLSKEDIQQLATIEYERARELFPSWQHPYSHIELTRSKRCFGQAHVDGRILLSQSFLGTTAVEDLRDTLRHEFAHLIVGIDQKHNAHWRCAAASLGATPKACGNARSEELNQRMSNAPFTLVAIMQSGEEKELRQVHRRSRRYQDYRYSPFGQRYHIDGEWVEHFRYDSNRS
ncbi:MAG: SprT-like domain-containing protein [Pseudomonadota bacterium]